MVSKGRGRGSKRRASLRGGVIWKGICIPSVQVSRYSVLYVQKEADWQADSTQPLHPVKEGFFKCDSTLMYAIIDPVKSSSFHAGIHGRRSSAGGTGEPGKCQMLSDGLSNPNGPPDFEPGRKSQLNVLPQVKSRGISMFHVSCSPSFGLVRQLSSSNRDQSGKSHYLSILHKNGRY